MASQRSWTQANATPRWYNRLIATAPPAGMSPELCRHPQPFGRLRTGLFRVQLSARYAATLWMLKRVQHDDGVDALGQRSGLHPEAPGGRFNSKPSGMNLAAGAQESGHASFCG